jgi:hypothetical protein
MNLKHFDDGVTLRNTGVLDFVLYTKNYNTHCFGNWISFRPQVKGVRQLLCWVTSF